MEEEFRNVCDASMWALIMCVCVQIEQELCAYALNYIPSPSLEKFGHKLKVMKYVRIGVRLRKA